VIRRFTPQIQPLMWGIWHSELLVVIERFPSIDQILLRANAIVIHGDAVHNCVQIELIKCPDSM
jgi:hypothetical protein